MSNEDFVERLKNHTKNTLMETLKIDFTKANINEGWLEGTMPVTPAHHQPFGILHGGALFSLAETLGSAGSLMFIDLNKQASIGLEMSGNHLKSKKDGFVTGRAKIVHKGKSTHLWEIDIKDEEGNLISRCKLTNMVLNKN